MNGENEGERRGKNGLNEMRLIYKIVCNTWLSQNGN
jgi:hypothetical protein